MDGVLRSVSVLAMAFVGVVLLTLGMATLILPGASGAIGGDPSSSGLGSPDDTPSIPTGRPTAEGGTLAVSGDRPGTFVLDHADDAGRYSLVGSDGRIAFDGDPVEVPQVAYDGLNFILDPGACTVAAADQNSDVGVAWADVTCDGITDVRGTATISISGRVGVAMDVLGLVTGLPQIGGSVVFGDRTLEATIAGFRAEPNPRYAFDSDAMQIGGTDPFWSLSIGWDSESDLLDLTRVSYGADRVDAVPGACEIGYRLVGRYSPRHALAEVTLECASVEVPGLGAVPISGTVVVDQFND